MSLMTRFALGSMYDKKFVRLRCDIVLSSFLGREVLIMLVFWIYDSLKCVLITHKRDLIKDNEKVQTNLFISYKGVLRKYANKLVFVDGVKVF